MPRWVSWVILGAIGLGCASRLIYPQDIEYKWDEIQVFELANSRTSEVRLGGAGLHSSGGLRHPALGLWVFVRGSHLLLSVKNSFARSAEMLTPVTVSQVTMILASLGLIVFATFAGLHFKRRPLEREIWLWAIALAAVNPYFVVLERKMWTPCLFPLFTSIWLMAWFNRKGHWLWAFLWGIVGASLGQLHLAGFYSAAALVLATAFEPGGRALWRGRRGLAWVAGSVAGAIPLVQWFIEIQGLPPGAAPDLKLVRLVLFKFWNFAVTNPLGFMLSANLGDDFYPFWKRAWGLVGVAHAVLYAALGLVAVLILRRFAQWVNEVRRGGAIAALRGEGARASGTESAFLFRSILLLGGLLMTLTCININRYYLLAFFPAIEGFLAYVLLTDAWVEKKRLRWLAVSQAQGRAVLTILVVLQAFLSVSVLDYIHEKGVIRGDYGVAYSRQLPRARQ